MILTLICFIQTDSIPKDESLYEKRKQLQLEVDEAKRKLGQQVNGSSISTSILKSFFFIFDVI